jgi:hypothetical protein
VTTGRPAVPRVVALGARRADGNGDGRAAENGSIWRNPKYFVSICHGFFSLTELYTTGRHREREWKEEETRLTHIEWIFADGRVFEIAARSHDPVDVFVIGERRECDSSSATTDAATDATAIRSGGYRSNGDTFQSAHWRHVGIQIDQIVWKVNRVTCSIVGLMVISRRFLQWSNCSASSSGNRSYYRSSSQRRLIIGKWWNWRWPHIRRDFTG